MWEPFDPLENLTIFCIICANFYGQLCHKVECSLPAVQSDVGGTLRPPFDQVGSLLDSVSGLQEALAASVSDPNQTNLQKLQFR